MPRPHRVLIVDDDALVRTGLRLILDSAADVEVVGEAADGDEVVQAVQTHAPDVVLMDLRMSRMDGSAATAVTRALPNPPHVIVLTTWPGTPAALSGDEQQTRRQR
ncbi:response regulator transcription factor [Occultella aeris]|uniref:Transcriptional regulatory protein LiaR n=1 Tax=Occultella aeris TaxID=2761496 RepID=A0A7M4DGG1_9MICO|nr:Transcriptional regulatory protein LiaR [Occultella aeris]